MNKKTVLDKLDYKAFYKTFFPVINDQCQENVTVKCCFHDDAHPSLSINVENGRFRCFACGAKGDVFKFYEDIKSVDFKTAIQEIAEMQGIMDTDIKQKIVTTFQYRDSDGKILYIKERLEPGRNGRKKEFRFIDPKTKNYKRPCDPVLYNLPALIKSKRIFVVEGERKTDLLTSWGLTATCLDSGAHSPWKDEYLKVLDEKEEVIILPDNDSPGMGYASRVANALYGKVEEIKIVELPGLKEAEDIIEWIKPEGNNKSRLLDILKETPAWKPSTEVKVDEHKGVVQDTPIIGLNFEALPLFLKKLVEMISPSTLAPNEFLMTALLCSMSSVIGTRAYVKLGRRIYYSSLWCMLIAPSSDYFKSTAIKEARAFIHKIDTEYEALSTAIRACDTAPESQRKEIDFADDETLESFYQTLHDNPDGGLLAFDEIGGWLQGFDKYRKGDGEKRRWLTLYDNSAIKYKRKIGKTNLNIEKPFVSIIGGITVNTFNTLFKGGITDIENGFLPRFIFCKTPALTKKDEDFLMPDVDAEEWEKAYQIFKKVTELRPGAVAPSSDGMVMLNNWYKRHQQQKNDPFFPDELSPFWRRIEGDLLKFALVFHQFKIATEEEVENIISHKTIAEAISLTEYYKGQARAVVRELCQGRDGRQFDELLDLLKKMGNEATVRQMQHAKASWRGKRDYLIEILKKMEAEGLIALTEYLSGGRKGLKAILVK